MINVDSVGNVTFLGVNFRDDIWYPNFSGMIDQYNGPKGVNPKGQPVGNRSFKVVIHDPNDAQYFIDNGWNIRSQEPRNPGDPPVWTLQVFLVYKNPKFAPVIFTAIDGEPDSECYKTEDTVDDLDHLEITTVDFTIHPYDWEYVGKTGRKAELQRMKAHICPLPF